MNKFFVFLGKPEKAHEKQDASVISILREAEGRQVLLCFLWSSELKFKLQPFFHDLYSIQMPELSTLDPVTLQSLLHIPSISVSGSQPTSALMEAQLSPSFRKQMRMLAQHILPLPLSNAAE